MLAKHQVGRALPDAFGRHDLVGAGVLQHAVLVDAAFMGKGIGADDRLVGLHRHAGDAADQARRLGDFRSDDAGAHRQHVVAHLDRHSDFLHRGVAGALADAVDCRFALPCPGHNRRQRVGDCQPQVIVAMRRKDRFLGARHAPDDVTEHRAIGFGRRITDGVGQVDRRRPRRDRRLHGTAQEIGVGPRGILRRPFDIVAQVAGMADRGGDGFEHRFGRHVELGAHMKWRGRDERVDARSPGMADCRPGTVDIGQRGAGQRRDNGGLALFRHRDDRFEIAFAGDGEAGFDDVDTKQFELRRNLQLFLQVHRAAGRLLTIAQRGVENADMVGHGNWPI